MSGCSQLKGTKRAKMDSNKITIIPLARKKLNQRGIDLDMIFDTISTPDQIVEGHGIRFVAQKRYIRDSREYLLRVVYEQHINQVTVITGYLTTQISRYWEERSNENRI